MLHSDFLPQTLFLAVLMLGSREQAGHCAQVLRSVAATSGRPFLGAQADGGGSPETPALPFPALGAILDPHSQAHAESQGAPALPPHQNSTA